MHIVVCINHIPDPEAPARQFKLDEGSNRPVLGKVNRVIGPFDENAMETALQLKDSAGAKVTAITVGPATNVDALRKALATKVDAAIHVKEDGAAELDSLGIARVLAAAVRKLADVDLVLCGRQVGDWDRGQVGQLVAEEMGYACVTLGRDISLVDGALRVDKEVPGGVATVESRLPAVVTITNTSTNQLRIAKVKDVMAAHRAPITAWSASDLGLDLAEMAGAGARVKVRGMYIPESNVRVEIIQGETDEEVAEKLARAILGLKVL